MCLYESLNLNYNYVFIGCDGYYQVGYYDLTNLPNVRYFSDWYEGFDSIFSKWLLHLCFSKKANLYWKEPFRSYVFPWLYPCSFNNKPRCYVFFGKNWFVFQLGYIEWLKHIYPDVKLVLYMQDLVEMNEDLVWKRDSKKFDVLISYDKGEANKYGMYYYPTPMSYINVPDDSSIGKSDVYFCGEAKTRYPQIHEIYKRLVSMGLKCDFNLAKMPVDAERVEGINYLAKPFTYTENLQHMVKSNCLLEIMQEGANGYTPRTWEAILYDKHLVTNNTYFSDDNYYYKDGIHSTGILDNPDCVDILKSMVKYPSRIKDKISPRNLIRFIDDILSK